ncbi:hypothetical protein K458DRAFT_426438 [Lentithecium fluviatile CBS 122367]|uniref:Uncharacterized protein n=1 Tax=Lentithecium fluviatile CBS 122367 TaxID=1168545 RepID=A0A6G1JLQ2_9PLEO|nr:hypothetical protein K458DRAFT_426438 [Lentithecium fluviatile CBS 122367]
MLDIHSDNGPDTKAYFSHSLLPSYIDPQNVSTKKKPFSTFNAQPFSHTLDLILPEEVYELVRAELEREDGVTRSVCARVFMKLGEILEGDFFTEYIKMGNIMMLSEGRPLVDNVFSLYEGILRLELDRPTYERCGLQGKPIEDGGKKHKKARWVIEFNLRLPSATHGKKGFSRLEWACKNVLNQSLTWLFYNLNPSSAESLREGKEPISVHQPFIHSLEPITTIIPSVLVPKLTVADLTALYDQEDALALHEYIHLLSLNSPRLSAIDAVDPHLSRYEVPTFNMNTQLKTRNMVRVRWRGFIGPRFVKEVFLMVRREGLRVEKGDVNGDGGAQSGKEGRWAALCAGAFGGLREWTVMQWAGRETLVWETEG